MTKPIAFQVIDGNSEIILCTLYQEVAEKALEQLEKAKGKSVMDMINEGTIDLFDTKHNLFVYYNYYA